MAIASSKRTEERSSSTQCFCLGLPGPQASTNPALFLYTLHHSVATCVWLPVNSGSLGSCPSHINGPGRGYLVISYFPIEAIVVGDFHSSLLPKMRSLSDFVSKISTAHFLVSDAKAVRCSHKFMFGDGVLTFVTKLHSGRAASGQIPYSNREKLSGGKDRCSDTCIFMSDQSKG